MSDEERTVTTSGWRARTAILALGAFVVGTDGYVIVGLLPQINATLHVTIAESGLLVSVFTLAYALLSPILAAVAGRWPRRRVLVAGLVLLGLGNAVTALADSYGTVLSSRALAGAGAAMFAANAVATAAHLAGERRRGSAIATVTVGSTLALVLGAPLGTVIGTAWAWQAAIWFITVIAALVAVAVAVLLPAITLDQGVTLRARLAPLADRRVLKVLAVTLFAFIGIFLPFTYMSAVFAPALGGDQARLALFLMVFGIAATAGNLTAGRLADRYDARMVVIGATLSIGAVFLVMIAARDNVVLAIVMEALAGLACFSVIGPQQHRIIAYVPPDGAPLVISLNMSTAYLGNFGASVIGAGCLASVESSTLVLPVAAIFAITAGAVAWWPGRSMGKLGSEHPEKTMGARP